MKSIWLACFSVSGMISASVAADATDAERTVVLFGASWCAPCRMELRDLPALASAVAPARLEIAWIDRVPSIGPDAIAANVRILSPQEARRKLDTIANAIQGLPIVAMIDSGGRPCAVARRPASVGVVRSLMADCSS